MPITVYENVALFAVILSPHDLSGKTIFTPVPKNNQHIWSDYWSGGISWQILNTVASLYRFPGACVICPRIVCTSMGYARTVWLSALIHAVRARFTLKKTFFFNGLLAFNYIPLCPQNMLSVYPHKRREPIRRDTKFFFQPTNMRYSDRHKHTSAVANEPALVFGTIPPTLEIMENRFTMYIIDFCSGLISIFFFQTLNRSTKHVLLRRSSRWLLNSFVHHWSFVRALSRPPWSLSPKSSSYEARNHQNWMAISITELRPAGFVDVVGR